MKTFGGAVKGSVVIVKDFEGQQNWFIQHLNFSLSFIHIFIIYYIFGILSANTCG
jgi:hypothetical protein